jgi:hypothetical protein
VHLERTPDTADVDEAVDELRLGGEELGELVGDDQERRERLEVGAAALACLLVIGDAREVARGAQQLLTAHDLALQGVLEPVDEGELAAQVRDDGGDVRHPRHTGEGRTALEVDEHEVQLLGRVREGEGEHESAQHLRLARPRCSDEHAVRPHALLGRFLQVEDERRAGGVLTDRHAQTVALQSPTPRPREVDVAHVGKTQQIDQFALRLDARSAARLGHGGPRAQRQETARGRLGLGDRHRVGSEGLHLVGKIDDLRLRGIRTRRARVREGDPERAVVAQLPTGRADR